MTAGARNARSRDGRRQIIRSDQFKTVTAKMSRVHQATVLCYIAGMDIHQRNNLRAEARLPLLDIAAEN
jgi:hypothetical protein